MNKPYVPILVLIGSIVWYALIIVCFRSKPTDKTSEHHTGGQQNGQWQSAANDLREKQDREKQEAAARQRAAAETAKQAEQVHKEGMAIINDVVQQFLNAMQRSGNPGRNSFLGVLYEDLRLRFVYNNHHGVGRPISSYWVASTPGEHTTTTVYANGKWRFSFWIDYPISPATDGGSYGEGHSLHSEEAPSPYRSIATYKSTAENMRRDLTSLMLKHKVRLPKD